MKLEDIIALAKQGYKPSDIKELISLAAENPDESKGTDSSDEPEQGEPEDEKPEGTAGTDADPDDIDYKKLYEDSQNRIKELQAKNANKDLSGAASEKSEQEILNDIVRDFM